MAAKDRQWQREREQKYDDEKMRRITNIWKGHKTSGLEGEIQTYKQANWRFDNKGMAVYCGHFAWLTGGPDPNGQIGRFYAAARDFYNVDSDLKRDLPVASNRCCVKETYDSNGREIRPGLKVIFDLVPNVYEDRFGNKKCEMRAVHICLKYGNWQRRYTHCRAGRHNRDGTLIHGNCNYGSGNNTLG